VKSVRIGHIDYKIVEMEKLAANENYGLYLAVDQEIHLCKNMTPPRRAEVLLHEIFHGIADHQNLELKDDEERVVRSFALGLSAVIRQNPAVFADILKDLK